MAIGFLILRVRPTDYVRHQQNADQQPTDHQPTTNRPTTDQQPTTRFEKPMMMMMDTMAVTMIADMMQMIVL